MKMCKYIHILIVISLLCSCSRENLIRDGYGYLTATVTRDNSIVEVTTKAEGDSDINFKLDIYNGEQVVKTVEDHKKLMTEPLQLQTAKYMVKAYNRDEVSAVFDSPRYAGETEIDIKPNTTVSANIKCSLTDVLVEPTFASEFGTELKSYSFTVTNGLNDGSLVWTSENVGKIGYFKVSESLDWTLSITNKADKTFEIKGSYANPQAKQKYVMNFKLEKDDVKGDTGAGNFKVVLDDEMTDKSFDYSLDFTTSEAEMKSANVWAVFADLVGEYKKDEAPDGVNFEYCKTGTENWETFGGAVTVDEAKKTFSARITGLEPATKYSFRAVSAKEDGKRLFNVETETAESVYNMGFDDWWMKSNVPMPNSSADVKIWDTANPGTKLARVYPTTEEVSHLVNEGEGKSAARLETKAVTIMGTSILAAGNIYTGQFGAIDGLGAKLNWGVPFTSRPLAMKGYFDYTPKIIDKYFSDKPEMEGKTDICQIQVLLTDWEGQFQINTQEGTFVDIENDPNIIAYGKLESDVTTSTKDNLVNGYEPFTIKLDYRDLTRRPTMIVIVAAASKYGDYFTGGVGSTLYLDEFSFVYDPAELEDAQ